MLKSITCACQLQVYRNSFVQLITPERFVVHRRNFFLLSHNCLFNNNKRNFVDKTNRVEQEESFIRFWERHRKHFINRSKIISKWTAALQCDEREATRLVENETELFETHFDSTRKKVELLMREGISSNTILNNIWMLHIAESRLRTYLRAMHLWGIEEYFEEFVLMFDVAPKNFYVIHDSFIRDLNEGPHGNRVLYLANRLECSVSDMLSRMLRKKFLMMKSIKLVDELLDVYKEFGVKDEDILSDLSCLSTSVESIRERLEKLREIGYHPIKPWLARYDIKKFNTAVSFFLAEKEAADYDSREGFVAAKMMVDLKTMTELKDRIQRKYPYFFRIRALTFMRKLKFLLSQGYVPEELLSSPYAFYPKISTIKVESNYHFTKMGVEKPRLPAVIKNEDAFQQLLDTLLANQRLKCSDIEKHSDFVTSSDCEKNN